MMFHVFNFLITVFLIALQSSFLNKIQNNFAIFAAYFALIIQQAVAASFYRFNGDIIQYIFLIMILPCILNHYLIFGAELNYLYILFCFVVQISCYLFVGLDAKIIHNIILNLVNIFLIYRYLR